MKSAADRYEWLVLSLMETAGVTRDEAEELMADTSFRRIARWKISNFENMTEDDIVKMINNGERELGLR